MIKHLIGKYYFFYLKLIKREFVLFYSIEMHKWNLNEFSLDLLEKKLSLLNPSQEQDKLVYEDWILMRSLKSKIYRNIFKNYKVIVYIYL